MVHIWYTFICTHVHIWYIYIWYTYIWYTYMVQCMHACGTMLAWIWKPTAVCYECTDDLVSTVGLVSPR